MIISAAALLGAPGFAAAETLTMDEFRRELVGLPLCGTPATGPLAGKPLCTVHLPDGTAVLAGSGLLVRGIWEVDGGRICRRNAHDVADKRRCVDYGNPAAVAVTLYIPIGILLKRYCPSALVLVVVLVPVAVC